MSLTTEQYDKIMRFLDAAMEPDEMDVFEKELAANPEMRKQLDFEQSVRDGFALGKISSLPDYVIQAGVPGTIPVNPKIPGKIKSIQKWLAVAAAIITAFTLFTVFRQKPGKKQDVTATNNIDTSLQAISPPGATTTEPAKDSGRVIDLALLFEQYFKKDALPEDYPLFLAEALTDYETGSYTTLQKLNLNNVPQTRGAGEADRKENILQLGHYYKGLAFLQTGNTRDAIINLHWVLNNHPDKTLRDKALWYLALGYLKENNREKAAESCRSIVNNKEDHILVKNAEKILDALGK
jgi:hypothetical protein